VSLRSKQVDNFRIDRFSTSFIRGVYDKVSKRSMWRPEIKVWLFLLRFRSKGMPVIYKSFRFFVSKAKAVQRNTMEKVNTQGVEEPGVRAAKSTEEVCVDLLCRASRRYLSPWAGGPAGTGNGMCLYPFCVVRTPITFWRFL